MPHTRLLRPSFFLCEALIDAEQKAGLPPRSLRMTYAGLWGQCDVRGIFQWQPRQLKAAICPWDDDVNMPAVLEALVAGGFVFRYEVPGRGVFGWIPTLAQQSTPKADERRSNAPPVPRELVRTVQKARNGLDWPDHCNPQRSQSGELNARKSRQRKGSTSGSEGVEPEPKRGEDSPNPILGFGSACPSACAGGFAGAEGVGGASAAPRADDPTTTTPSRSAPEQPRQPDRPAQPAAPDPVPPPRAATAAATAAPTADPASTLGDRWHATAGGRRDVCLSAAKEALRSTAGDLAWWLEWTASRPPAHMEHIHEYRRTGLAAWKAKHPAAATAAKDLAERAEAERKAREWVASAVHHLDEHRERPAAHAWARARACAAHAGIDAMELWAKATAMPPPPEESAA